MGPPAITGAPTPLPPCPVHEQVRAQAHAVPDQPAVVGPGWVISYGALIDRVGSRARDLQRLGVEAGSVVAVADTGTVDALVSVLAALERGAAYLPLRATLGPAATMDLLRRSGAVVHVDGADVTVLGHPRVGRAPDTAYVLPTSGTSGRPKLVQGTHLALRNLVAHYRETHAVGRGTRALWRSDLSWDTSTAEIFPSLCSGGAIVVADDARRRDPLALTELLVSTHVGRALLPPLILDAVLRCAAGRANPLRELDDIASGGDTFRVTAELLDHLEVRSDTIVENHYGPTETQLATTHRLAPDDLRVGATIPLGRPVGNMRLSFRATDDPLVFELAIDGPGLAAGYIGTEPGGFTPGDGGSGSTSYRTGDLVTIDGHGRLLFAGRADRQVKVGGARVELGEIESILLATRHLHAAVASVVDGRIVVAGTKGAGWRGEAAARDLVREMTSSGVTVHRVVTVGADLPTDVNGKVDVRRLFAEVEGEPGPSRTPLKRLRAHVDRLLGSDVDLGRSFLDNGGDSLAAIEAVTIAAGLGLDLRMRDLLREAPLGTALDLAATSAGGPRAASSDVGLAPFQRLQLAHHQRVGSTWVHQLAFDLTEPRSLDDLRSRWSQVVEDLELRGLDGQPVPGRPTTTVTRETWGADGRPAVRRAVEDIDWAADASPVLLLCDDRGEVVTGWILAHELALDPVSVHQLLWHVTTRQRLRATSPAPRPLVAGSMARELRARCAAAVADRPDAGTAASSRRVTRAVDCTGRSQEELGWVVSRTLGDLTGRDCPVDVLADGRRLSDATDLSACVGYFLTPVLVATAGHRRAVVSPDDVELRVGPRARPGDLARTSPLCSVMREGRLAAARRFDGGEAALRSVLPVDPGWRRLYPLEVDLCESDDGPTLAVTFSDRQPGAEDLATRLLDGVAHELEHWRGPVPLEVVW